MANANLQKHRVAKTKYKRNIVRPVFTGFEFVSPFNYRIFKTDFKFEEYFNILDEHNSLL
jgi:hypothetical protein